jgi:hypothetical protein
VGQDLTLLLFCWRALLVAGRVGVVPVLATLLARCQTVVALAARRRRLGEQEQTKQVAAAVAVVLTLLLAALAAVASS